MDISSSSTPYRYLSSESLKNALIRQPKQENPLQLNEFKFVLHRTPPMVYFCQSVSLPSIVVGETKLPTPFGVQVRRAGTSLLQDNLSIDFIVNENMSNWAEIRNWMTILINETDFRQQSPNEMEKFSDATLIMMNSNSKGFIQFTFKDIFPIELSSITLDTKVTDISPATCRATFAYSGFDYRYITPQT